VRVFAEEFVLPVASKHDSQDLCFVADGNHQAFLKRQSINGFQPGPILDQQGQEIGQHAGLPLYTIGQRKGLGISADQPLFVLQKDNHRNAIIVGPRKALEQYEFYVRDLNWISGTAVSASQLVEIKIRYKAKAVPGYVSRILNNGAIIKLTKPVRGVTPGQGAVFYNGDVCLGGGIITEKRETIIDEKPLSKKQPMEP
jgi:tRNA-specific 2-thiouridylase